MLVTKRLTAAIDFNSVEKKEKKLWSSGYRRMLGY